MAKVRRKNRVGIGLHCLAKDFGGLKHMDFKNLIIILERHRQSNGCLERRSSSAKRGYSGIREKLKKVRVLAKPQTLAIESILGYLRSNRKKQDKQCAILRAVECDCACREKKKIQFKMEKT
jgi:hypothetical protein